MTKDTVVQRLMYPPGIYALLAAYLLVLAALYRDSIMLLWHQWQGEDLSYGMLVPMVVAYIIWDSRERLARVPLQSSASGLLVVLLGVLFYWLGELGGEYYSLNLSLWFVVVGLCLLHWGWPKVKEIFFALFMMLTMFPFPAIVNNQITLRLKLLSSQVGVKLLHLYGMPAYREGNLIDLGFTQLQVVDACSGLRYLFPIIIMGLLLGYFFRLPLWKWALLVILTVPVIILNNGLRIAATGVLFQFFGPVVAEGFFHDFAGWFTFMTAFVLLLPIVLVLRRGRRRGENTSSTVSSGIVRPASAAVTALSLILLVGSLAASQGVEFRENIPLKKSLSQFPLQLDSWQGQARYMDSIYLTALDLSDYTMVDFRDREGNHIDFYVAYYESQRKGEAIHSPSSCLPGGGWELTNSRDLHLDVEGSKTPVTIRRTEMQMGDYRQLAYYWFLQRGRYLTNAYELKFYGFWDALTKRRTDGALVRLITEIRPGESVADAEGRLQTFVGRVVPLLDEFIPGAEG